MSASRPDKSSRKPILDAMNSLGASEIPGRAVAVSRDQILTSLFTVGASLAAVGGARADTIIVENPNVNIGFVGGDLSSFKLNLGSGFQGTLAILTHTAGQAHFLRISGSNNTGPLLVRLSGSQAARASYGKTFLNVGTKSTIIRNTHTQIATRFSSGSQRGANFNDEYFAFAFTDASSNLHYGWIYGTLSSSAGSAGYNDLSYNLISYAYDTTPNDPIPTGFTGAAIAETPEPSTLVMGAMAALIGGAAGVRKWNAVRKTKAEVVS